MVSLCLFVIFLYSVQYRVWKAKSGAYAGRQCVMASLCFDWQDTRPKGGKTFALPCAVQNQPTLFQLLWSGRILSSREVNKWILLLPKHWKYKWKNKKLCPDSQGKLQTVLHQTKSNADSKLSQEVPIHLSCLWSLLEKGTLYFTLHVRLWQRVT